MKRIDLLFLDIDGVLNNDKWFDTDYHYSLMNKYGYMNSYFDPKCVKNLNILYDSFPNLKVILSSSWRNCSLKEYGKQSMNDVFKEVGIKYKIFDKTPYMFDNRAKEILKYMEGINCRYIIVDDQSWYFRGYPTLMSHLIATDPSVGLTKDNINEIISVLNG